MTRETETVYFDGRGNEYTDETLRLAKERSEQLGIKNIVVASYTGYTGVRALDFFKDHNLVVVAGMMGFREPNEDRMLPENKEKIKAANAKIVKHLHAFGGLGRAVKNRFGPIQVDEIIANVLRLFSQGVKVCLEIACMASDSGAIRTGEECIVIAGTGTGADTALVLKPANTHRFFNSEVKEVICKPRDP
ncbi:MAG: pyruvate kinase alpha/beta domain-containing protein [Candidatus Bathyarchaeia archaeon]